MAFDASAIKLHVEARITEIERELSTRDALTDELARLRRALAVFLDPDEAAAAVAAPGADAGPNLRTTVPTAACAARRPAPRHRAACQGSRDRRG